MDAELRSLLIGTLGLDAALVAAMVLAVRRRPRSPADLASLHVPGWYAGTAALQFAHFAEEYIGGFQILLPLALGLEPWSAKFFVNLNLAWLAAWLLSVPLVRRGFRPVFFLPWFLAIAGVVNGIVHPLLCLRAGGWFPGIWTAPAVGVAGAMLAHRLWKGTAAPEEVSRIT